MTTAYKAKTVIRYLVGQACLYQQLYREFGSINFWQIALSYRTSAKIAAIWFKDDLQALPPAQFAPPADTKTESAANRSIRERDKEPAAGGENV